MNDESFIADIPKCHHIYHHTCVMDWLKTNPVCPYCRLDVVAELKKVNKI